MYTALSNEPKLNLYLLGALLALAGGALSVYFHGVYASWFSSRQWWIPVFCRMEAQQCTSIVDTPFGKILGRPNAEFGIIFFPAYAILLIVTGFGYINPILPLSISIFTGFVGMVLTYGLIKLKVFCRICMTVHFLNLINFLMQLWVFTS